jgi:PAS domain S-box-containing protein
LSANLNTSSLISVDQQLTALEAIFKDIQSYLQIQRPAFVPERVYAAVDQMGKQMPDLHRQINALEHEWRSLRALAQMGQLVNSSIELEVVLQTVMDTIIRLTGAERGFLMLRAENGELEVRIARNWERETLEESEFAVSKTIINQVAQDAQPVLTTNAKDDPRFGSQDSVVLFNLRSILCVPMLVKRELIGVIYADNRVRSGLFTRRHLELLTGFANQAATAIENARLFTSVRRTLTEVIELKNLMDNVFASIPSGVLTTDFNEQIQLCNRAAAEILGQNANDLLGRRLEEALEPLGNGMRAQVRRVLHDGETVTGLETRLALPGRGHADLRLSLSPLKDGEQLTQGVAVVLEDLTETRRLEAQRSLFERMVSPAVIRELNPDSLHLGGQRREITTLFADIRGFTSFSERMSPERLMTILNRYLAAAAEAVLEQDGTVDKFLGDAVMAWFNAPIPQPDHALRALRAAVAIRDAVLRLNQQAPEDEQLSFGVGIHTGDAVLGLVGSEKRVDYTAIGDSVNTTKRIQENANANQILISQATYRLVEGQACARLVQEIRAHGKRDPLQVYELINC